VYRFIGLHHYNIENVYSGNFCRFNSSIDVPDTEVYVQLNFNLLKEGVFTPPIHVYWTAHGVVIDPTLESTQIHFPYSHLGPDVEEKRWVSARVVDALGYTAKDNIFIYLITPPSVLPR